MPDNLPWGLPARSAIDSAGNLHLALLDIVPDELREPFLHETVNRLAGAAMKLVEVPQTELGRAPARAAPAGLVFHVSRCGSTLVSQLLRQNPQLVVYAEPLAVNELLMASRDIHRPTAVAMLRTLGLHFAQHASRPYILKLSSWNTLFCELFTEAFPQTPWVFCTRDPLEVCASLVENPPSWLRKENMELFAKRLPQWQLHHSMEERSALFFAACCLAIGRLDISRGQWLRYEAMPASVWGRLMPHFGFAAGAELQQRMIALCSHHAKGPVNQPRPFVPDGQRKRTSASELLRQAVSRHANPAFERLALEHWC